MKVPKHRSQLIVRMAVATSLLTLGVSLMFLSPRLEDGLNIAVPLLPAAIGLLSALFGAGISMYYYLTGRFMLAPGKAISSHGQAVVSADGDASDVATVASPSTSVEISAACRIRNRLEKEIGALSRRGGTNLVIGSMATLAAVVILASIALSHTTPQDNVVSVVPSLVLRLSLIVFIEVFAFFFLRLYKSSLDGIRYFQNELTTVEMKLIALDTALAAGDAGCTRELLAELVRTDRNVVLRNGESTVDVELAKVERQCFQEATQELKEVLSSLRN